MLTTRFGIEIEFTGITRETAAKTAAAFLNGTCEYIGTYYRTYEVAQADGRKWKFMSDGSINTQRKENGQKVRADRDYSVEMVSPILTYREDIETLQGLVRELRKAGGFSDTSCGIHIHLDGSNHTPKSIRNFINIIASKNDLLYKALQINPERARFCKKMDAELVEKLNRVKNLDFETIENIWYDGYYGSRDTHYHDSRYHFLNLHSFFHGHRTVELRGFNMIYL